MITDAFKTEADIERYIANRKSRAIAAVHAQWDAERTRLLGELGAATHETPLLDEIFKQYPNDIKRPNKSLTGRIPMRTFERIEKDLRKEMNVCGLRVWYYGKRVKNPTAGCTRRDEATHCMIYHK